MNFAKMLAMAVLAAFLCVTGCGSAPKPPAQEWEMGDQAPAGTFTYHVIETEWKSQLGEFPDARVPERGFLVVRLQIRNHGKQPAMAPPLKVEDPSGAQFAESSDGRHVPQWLGIVRTLAPGATDEGRILFDVAANTYKLRISDGADGDDEQFAYVKLPLSLDAGVNPGGH